jgi:hypothetical protein
MDDRKRSFAEQLDLRIARRRFESAFEACEKLADLDRQLLLREIVERASKHLRQTQHDEQKAVKVIGIKIEPH